MTKRVTKILCSVFFCFLFATIFIFQATIFVGCKSKENESSKFYFVYCERTNNSASAESLAKQVESSGGAGQVFSTATSLFVIANTYYDLQDAEQVQSQIVKQFPNCGIIELNCSLSKSAKKSFKKLQTAQNYYKKLVEMCNLLSRCSIKFDSGTIQLSQICKELVGFRQYYHEVIDYCSLQSVDLAASIKASAGLILTYIDSFFNSVFTSNSQGVQVKKLLFFAVTELYQIVNT